jgi:hypothetical protein
MNDTMVIHAAAALAERVRAEAGEDADAWPAAVVRIALQRGLEAGEHAAAADLLARHTLLHAGSSPDSATDGTDGRSPAQRALVDLCRAILNVNEFLHVD